MATSRNDLVLTGGALGLLMALYLTLGDPWQQAHAPPSLPNLQCQERGGPGPGRADAHRRSTTGLRSVGNGVWGHVGRVEEGHHAPTTSWLEQADTLPTLTDHPLHALRTYTMLHSTHRLTFTTPWTPLPCGSATAVPPVRKFREG